MNVSNLLLQILATKYLTFSLYLSCLKRSFLLRKNTDTKQTLHNENTKKARQRHEIRLDPNYCIVREVLLNSSIVASPLNRKNQGPFVSKSFVSYRSVFGPSGTPFYLRTSYRDYNRNQNNLIGCSRNCTSFRPWVSYNLDYRN